MDLGINRNWWFNFLALQHSTSCKYLFISSLEVLYLSTFLDKKYFLKWWPGPESNWRHKDFQSSALPTELPGQMSE